MEQQNKTVGSCSLPPANLRRPCGRSELPDRILLIVPRTPSRFRLRRREPRKGRNPKTGDRVDVPSKHVPYFKPGKELKDLINTTGDDDLDTVVAEADTAPVAS